MRCAFILKAWPMHMVPPKLGFGTPMRPRRSEVECGTVLTSSSSSWFRVLLTFRSFPFANFNDLQCVFQQFCIFRLGKKVEPFMCWDSERSSCMRCWPKDFVGLLHHDMTLLQLDQFESGITAIWEAKSSRTAQE